MPYTNIVGESKDDMLGEVYGRTFGYDVTAYELSWMPPLTEAQEPVLELVLRSRNERQRHPVRIRMSNEAWRNLARDILDSSLPTEGEEDRKERRP